MEHRLDMEARRRNCDERLNKLKEDEKRKEVGKAKVVVNIPNVEQKKYHILDPELCKAIREKGIELFLSMLETLWTSDKLSSESEIMGQAARSGETVLHLAGHNSRAGSRALPQSADKEEH